MEGPQGLQELAALEELAERVMSLLAMVAMDLLAEPVVPGAQLMGIPAELVDWPFMRLFQQLSTTKEASLEGLVETVGLVELVLEGLAVAVEELVAEGL